MDQERDEPRGFRVTDRRRFTEAGQSRPEDAPDEPAPRGASPEGTGRVGIEPEATAGGAGMHAPTAGAGFTTAASEAPQPAEVNFSTFVLSLSTQALLHLGEIPDPRTGAVERDLPAARQVIDILGVLKQKTMNNLEPAEQAMLDSMLRDLRLRFAELVLGKGKA